ncbi:MAG: hypothetical protein ACI9LM_002421 [Alteromonadaceae bacterium]|jgi:hypothetical protein
MNINSTSTYSDDLNYNDTYSNEFDHSTFDDDEAENQQKSSSKRSRNVSSYLIRKKIEARQEKRRLRDLCDEDFDR